MNAIHHEAIVRILESRPPDVERYPFLNGCDEVFVYGAGNCGRDVLKVLTARGIKVHGFLDGCLPPGTVVDGFPVRHPLDPAIKPDQRARSCIIVAIFNLHVDILAIIEMLKEGGYGHTLSFVEFFRYFSAELGDRYWLTSGDFYVGRESELAKVLDLLHDDESCSLYLEQLDFRMTGDYRLLSAPSEAIQYFDASVPIWQQPISFVDCGSFTGDTLEELYMHYGCVDTIVAFEPDLKNFGRLAASLRDDRPRFAGNTFLYPCGIWSGTETLRFAADNGSSCALSPDGASNVQCVALDDALSSFRPTVIKMDIEGAEQEALQGAMRLIKKHTPSLAICVYHRPEHLWTIPLILKGWNLGYKFYLRCYAYSTFDTVLYAIRG